MRTTDADGSIMDKIIEHYGSYDESQRLADGFGGLERARTQELIARYLPAPSAVVLDVGGASGAYSFWLADLGHRVHLVDIVPRHIQQARDKSNEPGTPRLAGLRVGDARALDVSDDFADVLVMHGPLYHLDRRDDRMLALAEARRVLRPGGILLAFAITRYAGAVFGLARGYVFDPEYLAMTRVEVGTGLRRNAPSWLPTFPRAYFHHPDELAAEIGEAHLVHERTLGVMGPAWLVPELDEAWQDAQKREVLLEVARMLEDEPALGPRLMAVARKPHSLTSHQP